LSTPVAIRSEGDELTVAEALLTTDQATHSAA
jgi:hypothetical protein